MGGTVSIAHCLAEIYVLSIYYSCAVPGALKTKKLSKNQTILMHCGFIKLSITLDLTLLLHCANISEEKWSKVKSLAVNRDGESVLTSADAS